MDAIDIAALEAGVCRKAILKRIRVNKARGLTGDDLLSVRRGGNYKITIKQVKKFWKLVNSGKATTKQACEIVGITITQGENIRSGRAWSHITGKQSSAQLNKRTSTPEGKQKNIDDQEALMNRLIDSGYVPNKLLRVSIIELFELGLSYKRISILTKASKGYISKVCSYYLSVKNG